MLGASRRWKDAGAISGSMIPEGPNYASIGVQIACFHEHLNLHPKGKRRLLASFSLLMTKDVWDKSGGFDPDLVIAEDVDFSVRLSILGFPLYLHPEAAVHHLHNRNSLGRLWRHSVESGRLSIGVRHRHRKWFRMTVLTKIRWLWWLLAPGISLLRTIQIYLRTPGLWRYLVYFPCVLVSKFGWCIGAGMSVTARNRFDEEQT